MTATQTRLADLALIHYDAQNPNRKPDWYLEAYEELLEKQRDKPLHFLELGVCWGNSMKMWRDYLPNATLVGFDIVTKPEYYPDDPKCFFIQGDQTKVEDLQKTTAAIGGGQFDIIIDDASHIGYHTKQSFKHLFPNALMPGGVYIIEDYQASLLTFNLEHHHPYDKEYEKDRKSHETQLFESYCYEMSGVIKQLMDHLIIKSNKMPVQYPISKMVLYPQFAVFYKHP
jgi:hypothetical protein